MEALPLVEHLLPLQIRSPRGGGGKSGSHGSSSSGSKGGKGKSGSGSSSSGGSSSGSSSSKSGSGSSSSSSSSGTTVVVVGGGTTYYNHGNGQGYIGSLPTWAVALIIIFSILLTLFLCALLYYCLKERKRSKLEGHSPRVGHALWKAVKVAFFIWLVKKIWECCARRGRKRGSSEAGSYSKIDEDGQHGIEAWYGSSTAPALPNAATAYGAGGKGHALAESKYEPMAHAGTGPSPLSGSRIEDTHAIGTLASPPPYTGAPITASITFADPYVPGSSTGGLSQSYYASMGMSGAYAPSTSSTYEPLILSAASTPVPAYQTAYHPPVSSPPTEYPVYPPQATYVPHTSPGPRYGGSREA